MKCDLCGKRLWFWLFNCKKYIFGTIAHPCCWEENEKRILRIKQNAKKKKRPRRDGINFGMSRIVEVKNDK